MNMLPAGDGTAQVEHWGGQYLIIQSPDVQNGALCR